MNTSKDLELLVYRIKRLAQKPGTHVTWNDKVPDPANPKQQRQIDISIRGSETLTIVECRFQKKKQDVKWIEELIGRRLSLRANSIIAVSSSGFSNGAICKAKEFGIFLREVSEISDEEILSWGTLSDVTFLYFSFSELKIGLIPNIRNDVSISSSEIACELAKTNLMYMVFQVITQEFQKTYIPNTKGPFSSTIELNREIRVKGVVFRRCKISGIVAALVQKVKGPSIMVYGAPKENSKNELVVIEQFQEADIEIQKFKGDANLFVDFSRISYPPNHFFGGFTVAFHCAQRFKTITPLGLPRPSILMENVLFYPEPPEALEF